MADLPPHPDDVLALARSAQREPDPATRARIRLAVSSAVATGAVVASIADGSRQARRTTWTLAHKVLLGLFVSSIPVAWWFAQHAVQAPARAAVHTPVEPAATILPAPAGLPDQSSPSTPEGSASDLREELQLLELAEAALQAHAAERALTLLARHQARYPRSSFLDERDGLRLIARCSLDHTTAAADARAYLLTRGPTLLRARVEAACGRDHE